jgi:hypothetical protein
MNPVNDEGKKQPPLTFQVDGTISSDDCPVVRSTKEKTTYYFCTPECLDEHVSAFSDQKPDRVVY